MLNPEADLREVVETLAESNLAEARDHISKRDARKLCAKAIEATRELCRISLSHEGIDHGTRKSAEFQIKLALTDLHKGWGSRTGL